MESLQTAMNTRRQSIVFSAPIVIPLTNSHPQSEFTSGVCARSIREDFKSGVRGGVNGTPAFLSTAFAVVRETMRGQVQSGEFKRADDESRR